MNIALLVALAPAALVILKATAVLLLALGLTTLMKRASAPSRYLVWVASLLALIAIPLLAIWSPVRFAVLPSAWNVSGALSAGAVLASTAVEQARAGALSARDNTAPTASSAGAQTSVALRSRTVNESLLNTATAATGIESRNVAPASLASVSLVSIIVGVWAAVALGLLGWLGYGAWSVRRIVGTATPLDDTAWQGTMIDIADRLSLDATPRLLRADNVTMPFACGLHTPTIVLPGEAESWSAERRAAVLLHELAHIRRRDIVGHTLGRVVCALYWFHPLAWTAARRLRAESERACDDLALGCGTRASDYAEHLLDIVTSVRSHGTPSVAMAMATRSEFEGRMLAILDPSLVRNAPTRLQASTLAGGVMMFAIVTGSAVPRAPQTTEPNRVAALSADSVQTRESTFAPNLSANGDTRRIGEAVRGDTQLAVRVDTPTERAEQTVRLATPQPSERPDAIARAEPEARPESAERVVLSRATPPMGRVSTADSSARASVLARILRTDTSASLRRIAAWGLQDFPRNTAAVEALVNAVRRDHSADVREMAAWALSNVADPSILPNAFIEVLRAENEERVRESIVWTLGQRARGDSFDAMIALSIALSDADPHVRELAAWGIGNAGPKRAPAALINALKDLNANVRATAAWALFEIKDDESAAAIEAALIREMDAKARWALIRAISVMGERAVAPLQRLVEGSDARARTLAIRALAGHGGDPWPQPRPRPRPFP